MKFKLHTLLILAILFFVSCENDKKEDVETISLEELIGDEEGSNQISEETDSIQIEEVDTLNLAGTADLIYKVNSAYDTVNLTDSHPMDRYGYSSVSKIKFVGKNEVPYGKTSMVTPKAKFFIYNFSDSIKLNNAFYNWLDCFGSDCNEIKLNQDVEAVKTPPSFTLVYDTTLIDVKYLCEHEQNDWKAFQKNIIDTYGKNYRYRIDVNCGGPLKWK